MEVTMNMSTTNENIQSDGYYELFLPYAVMWSLISFIGISGNSINLAATSRLQVGVATKVFINALSLSDLLTAISLITQVVVTRAGWEDSVGWDLVSQTVSIIIRWSSLTSATFIVIVNLDRFLHIALPFKYDAIINGKRAVCSTIVTALIVLAINLLCAGLTQKSFATFSFKSDNMIFVINPTYMYFPILVFAAFIWFLQIVVIIVYARMFCIVRRHTNKIAAQEKAAVRLKSISATIDFTGHASSVEHAVPEAPGTPTCKVLSSTLQNASPHGGAEASVGVPQRRKRKECKLKEQMKIIRQNLRNLRTSLLVTGCYLMAWAPYSIVLAGAALSGNQPNKDIFLIAYTMKLGCCCVNCFVYMSSRYSFKSVLQKGNCCR